jgi:hypothetical protein
MATASITEKDIRVFLMDKPELNPLLRGVRWSPEEIEAALVHCVSCANEMAPPTAVYTVETFPLRYNLMIGCAGHLLKSASINEANNNLSYQLDGVTVNDKDKSQVFAQLGQQFWDEFKLSVKEMKMAQNLSAAFGGFGSEFRFR